MDRIEALEIRIPPAVHDEHEEDHQHDEQAAREEQQRRRFERNRQGMRGNNNHPRPNHNDNNTDPFAKVKFSIPAFHGAYDAEAYLDWEMIVEQKLNSHLVPEIHRVRQATSEFKDFAIIWWNELVNSRTDPHTWDRLKEAMRARFVPPSYKRDLRKELQRLDQGSMSVQEYYQELQKGMIRCGVVEDMEDKMVRFYGGLNRDIQDLIDYKEYDTIQRLFHLAMLAEKELQGRDQPRSGNKAAATFTPRSSSTSNKGAPPSRVPAVPPTSATRPAAPSTPSRVSDSSKSTTAPGASKTTSSSSSTSRSSDIRYVATADGGYVSASDVEDEDIAAANTAGSDDDHDTSAEEILGARATEHYRTVIVQ